jgi:hypothetical protein
VRRRPFRGVAQQVFGDGAGLLDQGRVELEVGEAQQRLPRLPAADEFARAAQLQVFGGDHRSRRCRRG